MTAHSLQSPDARVSVVIPCFNQARYLQDAIASALAQTLPPEEIVVVDDGSKDDTHAVASRFQPPVQYIRQENRGLSAARNIGMRHANGELIALLDADDIWMPEFLATLVPLLQANPDLCAAHSGSVFMAEDGRALPQQSTKTVAAPRMFDALADGQFFVPSAVVARRALVLGCGAFDERLRAAEDWDLWLRLARHYPFGGVGTCLVRYRRHAENMSSDVQRMLENEVAVVEKNFGALAGEPARWPLDRRRAAASAFVNATFRYLVRGDVERGAQYLRHAFLILPALTERVEVFYELGCANQPLGWRGERSTIALEANAAVTLRMLAEIFGAPSLPRELSVRRRSAHANAFYAFGLLAYNTRQTALARGFLWRSLQCRPSSSLSLKAVTLLAKACAPPSTRQLVRSMRGTRRPHHLTA
jgi:hypothetical protein